MKDIVEKLIFMDKKIAVMESCTGGYIASSITNVVGASGVFSFGAVTYSNEYKIKMGVNRDIIDKYSVYSINTACEMSNKIAFFASSNYGVGITGEFSNEFGNNIVYISVYDRDNDKYYNNQLSVSGRDRLVLKEQVLGEVIRILKGLLNI